MTCIFCVNEFIENSLEHIVPESLGNKSYVLAPGNICRSCNNLFSKFEGKALANTMLAFERTRLGVATKRGNAAKGSSNGISFEGNEEFIKNRITLSGLNEKNIESVNEDGSINVIIQDFDKSEMATSKLMLKMGLESIFNSQRKIYNKYDFSALKNHLTNKDNKNWPLVTTKKFPQNFISIPRFNDKYNLKNINCELKLLELNSKALLFNFRYSVISYLVNLTGREITWSKDFLDNDPLANLYPESLKKKI